MKRKSYAILFYLKRSKPNKRGEAPIYMRITIDGLRAEASIHRSIKPEQWNTDKGYATYQGGNWYNNKDHGGPVSNKDLAIEIILSN